MLVFMVVTVMVALTLVLMVFFVLIVMLIMIFTEVLLVMSIEQGCQWLWCLTQEYSSPPSPGTLADITMQELGNHHHHCFHNHHDERPTFIIIITIIIITKSFQGQLGCMSWGDPRLSPSSFHPSGNGWQTKKLDEKRLDKDNDMPRKKRKQVRKRKKCQKLTH